MNAHIRRVAVVAGVMIIALLVNITVLQFRAGDLNARNDNRRVRDAEYAQNRGAIMVGNTAIAYSRATPNGPFAYQRVYPNPQMYAAVTGWYSYDYGRAGLESSYNTELAGTSDAQAWARLMGRLSGQTPRGANIQTTINPKAQQAAWDAMQGKKGAAVAYDYTTGAILAFVSTPSYDPSGISSTTLGTARQHWTDLVNDPNRPLYNRASREIYPPGSTFKLVTAAAAIEGGMNAQTQVASPTQLKLPQSSRYLGNESDCGGTRITLQQALAVSCNTAFAGLGLQLGDDALRKQAERFGFNQALGSDVPYAKSTFPGTLDGAGTALSSIGQGNVAASPLQMAMVAGAIANGGQGMRPYLVQEVRSANLQVLSSHAPEQLPRAVSPQSAQQLQQMMVAVVTDGTGQAVQIDGVTIGGKTGTAQSASDRKPYAWFVCYSTQPHVAIAVFIEDSDVERNDVAGGRLAAPVAKAIIGSLR